jgi:hypothetical protein
MAVRLSVAGLASSCTLSALAASGTFTFVSGDVTLVRANGQRVRAMPNVEINPGDVVITGSSGMAQLTMIDQARLALRANTEFKVDEYAQRPDSTDGAVLSLVRGTLRAFTGLIASRNKDKFLMKTRTATVGIRGSGNILHTCSAELCDEEIRQGAAGQEITINHTIEGSHEVSSPGAPGSVIVTGPGQTVRVAGGSVQTIPTPNVIKNVAVQMAARTSAGSSGDAAGRAFAPGDSGTQNNTPTLVGNNGLISNTNPQGGSTAPLPIVVGPDPLALRDIVYAGGVVNAGQALPADMTLDGLALRSYRAYAGLQSGLQPTVGGGAAANLQTLDLNGTRVVMGRWDNATLGLYGSANGGLPGSVHFIYAASGYPTYITDVLTGSGTYTLAAATSPTNQNGTAGTLGSARLDVNFSTRTLNANMQVTLPAAAGNAGGSWTLNANGVPILLNSFGASTGDRLVITNGAGQSSTGNAGLYGAFAGSFVGQGASGAIVGYGFTDQTSLANFNRISGVAAFNGPAQNVALGYRPGLISDTQGQARNIGTIVRPESLLLEAGNRVVSFSGPFGTDPAYLTYSRGTANVAESGFDADTGLVWGRWSGGTATVGSRSVALTNQSLHHIFGGAQAGPTTLPLTGQAEYTVIGNTSPTDGNGNVGRLNSASLNANFSNRTVTAGVNFTIASQTWNAAASNMPIYRDTLFGAYTGVGSAAPLVITCTPNCGTNASGSLDGFFTGRTGQGAGIMYNINAITGTVAFRRPGN